MAAPYTAYFERIAATGPTRAETLARLDAISRLLDTAFLLPGTRIRFGIDSIIRLVPGIGDLATTILSSYLIWEAKRLGLPGWKIARMIGNVVLDATVGAVPILGDAVDVFFRANRRNMRIIREHFEAEDRRRSGIVDATWRVVEPRP